MKPVVMIVMGSESDWATLKHAAQILESFSVVHEAKVVSAHRTPDYLFEFSESLEQQGVHVVIAGAGGAAHLPGMLASKTSLPVLGVPVETSTLKGLDSLLSINQMPKGIPVGTLAVGPAGAVNAALLAVAILSLNDVQLKKKLVNYRKKQTQRVLSISSLKKRKNKK
ncbi:5-(carboxyamino)imidazole ribonucleotide mutase [bacterium]|nr:5-(carboxyamino)imidazole ribonucleotide mutase [bacterium]NBX81706.1 5-(carboxyamino)imidazole ribonucleotide mutase [bacterium]